MQEELAETLQRYQEKVSQWENAQEALDQLTDELSHIFTRRYERHVSTWPLSLAFSHIVLEYHSKAFRSLRLREGTYGQSLFM